MVSLGQWKSESLGFESSICPYFFIFCFPSHLLGPILVFKEVNGQIRYCTALVLSTYCSIAVLVSTSQIL